MKVRIADIVIDPTIQIRQRNHRETIERYKESFESLPPVTVFETPEGKLLADGFHRIAAADELGHEEIEAVIRQGTRDEASEYAVVANARSGDPLTREERDSGIRRLKLHGWDQRRIGREMGVSQPTVQGVLAADEVKQKTLRDYRVITPPPDKVYREISRAPEEHWQPLVEAAQQRRWTGDEAGLAVQALRSEQIPADHKRAILAGEADPPTIDSNGKLGVPVERVERVMRDVERSDGYFAFQKVLGALASLRVVFDADQIVEGMDAERRSRLVKELRTTYIPFFEDVAKAAESRRLEAVK